MSIHKVGDAARTPTTRAVLNLDFSNSKSLDPRVQFSRSSTATYFSDSETFICDENRFHNSSDLTDSNWSISRHTIASGQTDPYGGTTAYSFTQEASTNSGFFGDLSWEFHVGVFTYSVWAKAGPGGGYIRFDERQAGAKVTWFDLSAGVVATKASAHTAHIEDAGNGWYRCSITVNSISTNTQLLWYFANANGVTTVDANLVSGYLWGPQFTRTDYLGHYVPTIGMPRADRMPKMVEASVNIPRFDTDPYTSKSLGIAFEGARTNLITNSKFSSTSGGSYQSFAGSNGSTFENEYGVGLDGTNSARMLRLGGPNHNSSASYWYYTGLPLTSGTKYTFSVYVKMLDYTNVEGLVLDMHSNSFSNNGNVKVNLFEEPGVLLSGGGGLERERLEAVGNGWYRISGTATSNGSGYFDIGFYAKRFSSISDTTDATVDSSSYQHAMLLWGPQLEVGSGPTSHIPTTNGAVTRSSEGASLADVHKYITPASGMTVSYKRIVKNEVFDNSYTAQLVGGGGGFVLFRSAGTSGHSIGVNVRDTAGYNGSVTSYIDNNEALCTISFHKDQVKVASNGIFIGTDSTVYYESEWNTLYLGGTGSSNERLNGYISHFAVYPEELNEAQLKDFSEE